MIHFHSFLTDKFMINLRYYESGLRQLEILDTRLSDRDCVVAVEENENGCEPYYVCGKDLIVSPVYIAAILKETLCYVYPDEYFACLINTHYTIQNSEEMDAYWMKRGVEVNERKIKATERENLDTCQLMYDTIDWALLTLLQDMKQGRFRPDEPTPAYRIPDYIRMSYLNAHCEVLRDTKVCRVVDQLQQWRNIDDVPGMEELNKMVGLDDYKSFIYQLICDYQLSRLRQLLGLHESSNTPLHLVFTGNPGTGKTTAAKVLGKALHAAGILSRGDVVCRDRSSLVGRHVGDSENNVRELFEGEAHGNVVLIDEAYALAQDHWEGDFGHHVINSLLPYTSVENPDYVVVLCGYKKEMDRLLDSNPGLRSRFSLQFDFADYSCDQLMEICARLLGELDYRMTDEAQACFADLTTEVLKKRLPQFGNARWVHTAVRQYIVLAQHRRVTNLLMQGYKQIDRNLLRTIDREDVVAATDGILRMSTNQISSLRPSRQRIGFAA